jgi:hypothetical protein
MRRRNQLLNKLEFLLANFALTPTRELFGKSCKRNYPCIFAFGTFHVRKGLSGEIVALPTELMLSDIVDGRILLDCFCDVNRFLAAQRGK